ncbi:MAG: sulfite exporter TauE/SafE family protein [Alphaproteobacteria bacterium]
MDMNSLMVLVPALAITGLAAGTLAGLLGVGGGIVIVPVLRYLLVWTGVDESVAMHLAVGTSLATIIPTSIISMRSHHARGGVDWDIFKGWFPGIALGCIAGGVLAKFLNTAQLTAVFGIIAFCVALQLALSKDKKTTDGDEAPPRPLGLPLTAGVSGFVGLVSSLMGIGGGSLTVPILTWRDWPIRRAVGTASSIGLIIAIWATASFIWAGWGVDALPDHAIGYVSWLGFALIVPFTMLAAPFGAKLAHTLPTGQLRKAFALFLGIVSIKMMSDLL